MSDFDIAQKAASANEELQTARRGLKKLKEGEAQYLADRESKAKTLLKGLLREIESASAFIEAQRDDISRIEGTTRQKLDAFEGGLVSVLDLIEKIVEKSDHLEKTSAKTAKRYTELTDFITKQIGKLSETEKKLKKREIEVEKKSKIADEKLAEAEKLAYWHDSGQEYKDTRK